MKKQPSSLSDRVLVTATDYAKENYLYVQEAGTLTSLKPHVSTRSSLNSFLFFIVTKGKGTITYDSKKIPLSEGDCIFIDCRKGYSHESSASNPWRLIWVHFNGKTAPDLYHSFCQYLNNSFYFHPTVINHYILLLNKLHSTNKNSEPMSEFHSNCYLYELFQHIFTDCKSKDSPQNSLLNKLVKIKSHIELNFREELSLDELSARFYISKYHLAREYHKAYGITILNEINNRRLAKAKELLRYSQDSIEEIGLSCGYTSAGYFTKVFKAHEGMTPKEYRHLW